MQFSKQNTILILFKKLITRYTPGVRKFKNHFQTSFFSRYLKKKSVVNKVIMFVDIYQKLVSASFC